MVPLIEFWKPFVPDTPPHSHTALSLAHGTLIACEDGDVAVENIKAGDIVNTVSDGPQVVRWVGASPADTRPQVCIEVGALGQNSPTQPLRVSLRHRIALTNWRAELLFGSPQVLIEAKALVNGTSITTVTPEMPHRYYHILFDNHEIISAHNATVESFHPNELALGSLPEETQAHIKAQLPHPPKPLALPTITAAEAALLT